MFNIFFAVFLCLQSSDVKYLTLHNLDEVLEIFTNQEKADEDGEEAEGMEEDQEEDSHFCRFKNRASDSREINS